MTWPIQLSGGSGPGRWVPLLAMLVLAIGAALLQGEPEAGWLSIGTILLVLGALVAYLKDALPEWRAWREEKIGRNRRVRSATSTFTADGRALRTVSEVPLSEFGVAVLFLSKRQERSRGTLPPAAGQAWTRESVGAGTGGGSPAPQLRHARGRSGKASATPPQVMTPSRVLTPRPRAASSAIARSGPDAARRRR